MKVEPVPLFVSRREIFLFVLALMLLFAVSLGTEYRRYVALTAFDSAVVEATVLDQYLREKDGRKYTMLRLRSEDGFTFFMADSQRLRDRRGYRVAADVDTSESDFLSFLRGSYFRGFLRSVGREKLFRYRVKDLIAGQHAQRWAGELYAALFTATPVPRAMRERLSALGVSHLLAISGFHIGLLSLMLFAVVRIPYRWMQSRFFPWRHGRRDLFAAVAVLLLMYVLFVGMSPSVLRSYAMLLAGFFFYDRGIRVVSFASLAVTAAVLLVLWPRLLWSLGFWLSVGGVFFIFLFLRLYAFGKKSVQFVALHVWIYLMMLPWSLWIFGTFSLLHPLSIFWTMLFFLFYPLELGLHLLGAGGLPDGLIAPLLSTVVPAKNVAMPAGIPVALSVLGLLQLVFEPVKRLFLYLSAAVLVGAVYQIT